MNTWKRCNKCTPKPLQDVHFFFWPNRMLSDSVIASLPRGGFYYKLGFCCIMYKLSSSYVLWVTDQVFCHWFMASVWSALTVNQWGKWESVTLSMDWEYEASNFFFISEVNWHVGKGECYGSILKYGQQQSPMHVLTGRCYTHNKQLLIN